MKLIVGLGNPGEKYWYTRHNIGFRVIDHIARERGVIFHPEPELLSRIAEMGGLDDKIRLVAPQAFMNESGHAVQKCKDYWKTEADDIWVVHDDMDLEFGKVRIVFGGSSAGHKGVESIIHYLGTEEFWRVRIGIGRDVRIPTEDWVLKSFESNVQDQVDKIIDKTAEEVIESLDQGLETKTFEVK